MIQDCEIESVADLGGGAKGGICPPPQLPKLKIIIYLLYIYIYRKKNFFTCGNSVKCQTMSLLLKGIMCENFFAFKSFRDLLNFFAFTTISCQKANSIFIKNLTEDWKK